MPTACFTAFTRVVKHSPTCRAAFHSIGESLAKPLAAFHSIGESLAKPLAAFHSIGESCILPSLPFSPTKNTVALPLFAIHNLYNLRGRIFQKIDYVMKNKQFIKDDKQNPVRDFSSIRIPYLIVSQFFKFVLRTLFACIFFCRDALR
jgi:hypothetical protein